MQTTRLEKIQRLLQKELSEIFRLETAKMGGVLVSVSSVRVSPDLSVARVHLSIFPSERGKELLSNINDNAVSIRYNLAQRVRYQLRRTPELTFYIDDSLDYIDHIDQLLHPEGKPGTDTPEQA
ncbi:MAG: 30S ribosome-binding factor RbfA [Muribaculaceae bacterium]|nr:30S ribosome-binding factor RbfA [Muribaculaceae bacterium]